MMSDDDEGATETIAYEDLEARGFNIAMIRGDRRGSRQLGRVTGVVLQGGNTFYPGFQSSHEFVSSCSIDKSPVTFFVNRGTKEREVAEARVSAFLNDLKL